MSFIFSSAKSQSKSKKDKKYYFIHGPVGYFWQGTHNFELGLEVKRPLRNGKGHDNFSLIASAIISPIRGSTYLTPSARLRYYDQLKGTWFGWEVLLGYGYTNIHNKTDHRLTPEAGISYNTIHITYGYNFGLSKYNDGITLPHRVALRFTAF